MIVIVSPVSSSSPDKPTQKPLSSACVISRPSTESQTRHSLLAALSSSSLEQDKIVKLNSDKKMIFFHFFDLMVRN